MSMSRLQDSPILTDILWRLRKVRRLEEAISRPWEQACGLSAYAVFSEIQRLGYARTATAAESLADALSLAQVKAIATELGLKATGQKQRIIDAILAFNPEYPMPSGIFAVLTADGSAVLQSRLQQRAEDETATRRAVVECLRHNRVQDGLSAAQDYINRHSIEHLMPNPLGITIPDDERIEDAEWILANPHEVLNSLPADIAERVRYEAILSVFGLSYSADLTTIDGGRYSKASEVARILELSARYAREVRCATATHGAAKVQIEFLGFPIEKGGCPACQKATQKVWRSTPLPAFPFPDCSRREGCTVSWALDIRY